MKKNNDSPLSINVDADFSSSLFGEIDAYFNGQGDQFFKHVVNQRVEQFNKQEPSLRHSNIATKLHAPLCTKEITMPWTEQPGLWHDFELKALTLFDNLAKAWCAFNIWKINRKYQNTSRNLKLQRQPKLTQHESDYTDTCIENIENHTQLYYTQHSEYAMTLSDAVMITNLATFIWEHQWYEMLYEIDLSSHGTHFILSQQVPDLPFPVIVSTAKIHRHHQVANWLYFSPFFQTSHWKLINKFKMQQQLADTGLLSHSLKIGDTCSAKFENTLWDNISDHKKCCEIIRLTVSGTQSHKVFSLYLSQKRLLAQLDISGYQIAFVVIEQPLMIHYYQSLTNNAYLKMSYRHLSESRFATYKGLWFIKPLNHALSNCSYRKYKVATISQLKEEREQGSKQQYA